MFSGHATPDGTARFAGRFPSEKEAAFFREAQGLTVSSLGMGTYLGGMEDAVDARYTESTKAALRGGINFVDTSLNYRNERSERSIGAALLELIPAAEVQRDEVVLCSKAGYLVPNAMPDRVLGGDEVVNGMHCMAPAFLADQLDRSRHNLNVDTVDVFYLHNPETQLNALGTEVFHERMRLACEQMERFVAEGKIRYYGVATWDGFRRGTSAPEGLQVTRLVEIAQDAGGDEHHLRFIQLPFNFAMTEAYVQRDAQYNCVLTLAERHGITVVASASLLQSRLARNLPAELAARLPQTETDAQRAIQFTRSTPGITVALAGMSHVEHVRENLGIASVPPIAEEDYVSFYQKG